jgi:hypothetical protein
VKFDQKIGDTKTLSVSPAPFQVFRHDPALEGAKPFRRRLQLAPYSNFIETFKVPF